MATLWKFLLVVVVVLFTFPALAQEEHWLQYHTSADIYRDVGGVGGQQIAITASPPAGLTPAKFTGSKTLFGQWSSPLVKNGKIAIALDQSEKDGRYDRFYIDSNGNGSLADETPATPKSSHQYGGEFGPVKVLLEGEDGPVAYHLQFHFSNYQGQTRLYARSACWYEGTITAGGKKWRCLLIDYNANGTFNDLSPTFDYSQIDRIGIGPAVDGSATTKTAGTTPTDEDETQIALLGKYVQIADEYYHPEPARDGAFLKLASAGKVPMGKVRVHKEITRLSAAGENGLLTIRPVDGLGQLPFGKYYVYEWRIDRTKDGAKWRAKSGYFANRTGGFEVTAGKEAALDVGEPITVALDATKAKETYSFNQKLEGKLGEPIELSRDGNTRPSEPRLEIKNRDGAYRKTLTFEYG